MYCLDGGDGFMGGSLWTDESDTHFKHDRYSLVRDSSIKPLKPLEIKSKQHKGTIHGSFCARKVVLFS